MRQSLGGPPHPGWLLGVYTDQAAGAESKTVRIVILTRIMSGASICRYANRHLGPARADAGHYTRERVCSPNARLSARFSETFREML